MSNDSNGYLARFGAKVLDNGYQVIPIQPGEKYPYESLGDWRKMPINHAALSNWLSDTRYRRAGAGIKADLTPGVDLDITHKATAEGMAFWIRQNFGLAMVRVGDSPKSLLVFRSSVPFPKTQSREFNRRDESGALVLYERGKHKGKPVREHVEVLGAGQQFVIYHTHPDTGRPYEWRTHAEPLNTPVQELPELTQEAARAICDEFERRAIEMGWTPYSRAAATPRAVSNVDYDNDDPFITDTPKAEIGLADLTDLLMRVPDAQNYHQWVTVGMALHHQFDGDEIGRELWHDWSSTAHNYDKHEVDKKWDEGKFEIEGKARAPVTARYIIKVGTEALERENAEALAEIKAAVAAAETVEELKAAGEKAKTITINPLERIALAGQVQSRFKKITGSSLNIGTARELVRYQDVERQVAPTWLKRWVYAEADDKFVELDTQRMLTPAAFDRVFSRYLLTREERLAGVTEPANRPTSVALNQVQLPTLWRGIYLPGEEEIFSWEGRECYNRFRPSTLPETPDTLSPGEQAMADRIERHINGVLLEKGPEVEIVLDWMAYIVQTHKRPNFALVIQGTEMDGKTIIGTIMAAALGSVNVNVISPSSLEEKFTGWAEGAMLGVVEEIKLHGHNRFDIMNRIKPNITNDVVSIRKMQTDVYDAPNTMAYLLFTNFMDALPLAENDTRYYFLSSRFQSKEAITKFKAENPDYFTKLFACLRYPGVIRRWLLDRKLSPNFNPVDRAPDTKAKEQAIFSAMPDELETIRTLIDDGSNVRLCATAFDTTHLNEAIIEHGGEAINTSRVKRVMMEAGFTFLGRFRIRGELGRFWTKKPELYDMKNPQAFLRDFYDSDM